MTEKAAPGYAQVLESVRKGLRSCLDCRTSFPNHLALIKHGFQGCRRKR